MSAATADRGTQLRKGDLFKLLLAASTELFAGTMICTNSSGLAVNGSDATGLRFAGVAMEGRKTADGDDELLVRRIGVVKIASSGLAAGDVGKPVFLADNQTVRLAGVTTYGIYVGRIHSYISATSAWVELDVGGELAAYDVITERTPGVGVTIDSVLLKDGSVGSSGSPATNVTATTVTTDTIAEKTSAAGVTIDGVRLKDGVNEGTLYASNVFVSTVQTANGSAQNVAHGFGVTPVAVFAAPVRGHNGAGAVGDKMPELVAGAHTSTNCIFTAEAGSQYRVIAFK